MMEDILEVCPRCGEESYRATSEEISYGEAWGAPYAEQELELDCMECECGFYLDIDEEVQGIGIKDILNDGFTLDDEGYLFDEDTCVPNLQYIEDTIGDPSEELIYFINGLRPEQFEDFTLFNDRRIIC